jgi:choline dehydrogenase-like flavoprotein
MEAGHRRHHREETTTMVWSCQKDARESVKINYGMDTTREKKKRTSKKNVDGRSTVQAAMKTRRLDPDKWRSREEWRSVSGRRRQLL